MKTNLLDFTFLILIRLDSMDRLENILLTTESLCKYFHTNIWVLEAAPVNTKILSRLLNHQIIHTFIEDKDPVLYKTKYVNYLTEKVNTPFMVIWDADIAVDPKAILKVTEKLRSGEADVGYPYNGTCYETSEIMKKLYSRKKDIRLLERHKEKMDLLYKQTLVGGAVFLNVAKFIEAGLDNEKHYGWGNDDYDRYERFKTLNYSLFRTDNPLYHLYHPRGINSYYRSGRQSEISNAALHDTINSNQEEISA
ncbi:MAG: hypothetical protein LIP06_06405 [Tannerellaceae bacterium]|nr:hypothetical protein [Tannerellaceae bacterium]